MPDTTKGASGASRDPWTVEHEREALRSVLNEVTGTLDMISVAWGASLAFLRLREYANWDPNTDASGEERAS